MSAPILKLLDSIDWIPTGMDRTDCFDDDLPFATHTGKLVIGPLELDCVQLSTGERLFTEESLERAFPGWKELMKQRESEK